MTGFFADTAAGGEKVVSKGRAVDSKILGLLGRVRSWLKSFRGDRQELTLGKC